MSITSITTYHLNQLKELAINLTDQQLSQNLRVLGNATIGAHVRHILEFYICLLDSVKNYNLNYDKRKRDSTIEIRTDKCVIIIDNILDEITQFDKDFELTLCADYSTTDICNNVSVKTTFFRELLYNIEHLVHHLAIIKIGVEALESSVTVSKDFGIAASTIRNKNICAQ